MPADLPGTCYCAGDWWYAPYMLDGDGTRSKWLGTYYYEHNAHRPPIFVVLPGGSHFCVDMVPSAEMEAGGHGWTVTGSPEEGTLAVSPSINAIGLYHGWLGIAGTPPGHLSDDLEGRAATHAQHEAVRRAKRAAWDATRSAGAAA